MSLDHNSRVSIPAHFIHQITDKKFHIFKGSEINLLVYPAEVFNKKKSVIDIDMKIQNRRMMKDIHTVICDDKNRIIIPEYLAEYANIKDKVLITGVMDKLLFWNPEEYDKYVL